MLLSDFDGPCRLRRSDKRRRGRSHVGFPFRKFKAREPRVFAPVVIAAVTTLAVFSLCGYVRHVNATLAFPAAGRRVLVSAVTLSGAIITGTGSGRADDGSGKARAALERTRIFRQTIAESGLEDWKLVDYEAMRDDVPRTSKFESAIRRRLAQDRSSVVVDIGTGPFALLALIAARAGAQRVYAIEKNVAAAALAREAVAKAGFEDCVQVIEGDSMQVELPERADLVVSELIGSIATQEGVAPIIRDARRRFLKADAGRDAMIPARCQTLVAPIWYQGRSVWDKVTNPRANGLKSRGQAASGTTLPLRIRASDEKTLRFLSAPQLLEDFNYGYLADGSVAKEHTLGAERQFTFEVPSSMALMQTGGQALFSGFAMWTRVVVDDANVVEVRGQPDSHWAFVVALMAPDPARIAAPGLIKLQTKGDYSAAPVRYSLEAEVTCAI